MSHDDQGQAGASGRSVPVSSFVLRRQAQAWSPKELGKGFHIGATRQDQQNGMMEVTVEPKTASPPEPLASEDHL